MKASVFGWLLASAALMVSFQNCSKAGFSSAAADGVSSSSSGSSASGSVTTTSACISYEMQGNSSSSASYYYVTMPAGTKVYQQLGCNGRGLSVGYQESYCDGGLGACDSCVDSYSETTCGADGNWKPSSSASGTTTTSSPTTTSTPSTHSGSGMAGGCK